MRCFDGNGVPGSYGSLLSSVTDGTEVPPPQTK